MLDKRREFGLDRGVDGGHGGEFDEFHGGADLRCELADDARQIGSDQSAAAGQGLDEHQREPLVEGRKHADR